MLGVRYQVHSSAGMVVILTIVVMIYFSLILSNINFGEDYGSWGGEIILLCFVLFGYFIGLDIW